MIEFNQYLNESSRYGNGAVEDLAKIWMAEIERILNSTSGKLEFYFNGEIKIETGLFAQVEKKAICLDSISEEIRGRINSSAVAKVTKYMEELGWEIGWDDEVTVIRGRA